jgi:PAS domain S-box-containing protein
VAEETPARTDFNEQLLDANPDGVLAFDREFRYTAWNRAMERISGLKREQVLGRVAFEVFPFLAETGEDRYFREALAGRGSVSEARTYSVPESGRRGFFDGHYSPLYDSGGQVVGGLAVIRDITARKRAEEAMRATEHRFLMFMENLPGLAWIKDAAGRYVYVNDAAERAFHAPRGEVLGKTDHELFPAETAAEFREHDRRALESEAGLLTIETLEHDDGLHHSIVSKFRIPNPDGGEPMVGGMAIDVTERMRAEEALRESEEKYRSLLENANDIIYSHDLRGRYLTINRACAEVTGYTREEILGGLNIAQVVVPEHMELAKRMTELKLRDPSPTVYEIDILTRDGRRLTLEVSTRIARREGREPIVEGIARDVTERRRAEEALRQSEERFARAFESSPLALTISSLRTGHLLEVNETFTRLSGYAREEAVGRTTLELGLWVEASEREAGLSKLSQGGHVRDSEQRFRLKDGTVLVGRVSAEMIEIGGEPCVLTVIQDVTEQKLAERERERMLEREKALRARAEEANRLKDEFLATVSHELRTPLTAIIGWSHMLEQGPLDEETARHAVTVIRRNAEQQRQIVEDILDVSRVITGKLRIESARVELATVVQAAIDTVRPAAESKGIRLRSAFDPWAVVAGDPHRLQQIAWNLISNAVKFTPAGGEVRVAAERLPTHVRIEVSDTGQGINPEFLPFVFDRFRQADSSTTRRHGGLGLGLAIVRHLVELHGGTVQAYSAGEGQGATFTVRLPLPVDAGPTPAAAPDEQGAHTVAEGSANAGEAGAQPPPPLLGVRLLLVDDNEDTLEMLALFLRRVGAEVTAATSAVAALDALERARPDVIVADIGMAEVDGHEFIGRVRSRGAAQGGQTPAIALTAYARDADRALALSSGFQAHLSKPVEPQALVAAIVNLAGRAAPREP